MINLNTVYKAEAQPTREFTIIPKGTYRAEIVEVEDWKINKTKNPIVRNIPKIILIIPNSLIYSLPFLYLIIA